MVPNNRRPWGTCATPLRTRTSGRALVASSPPRVTVPDVARTRPLRTPSRVGFPAPFAPTSAISSPAATSRSIPNSTGPASYPAFSARTSSKGSGLEPFRIALPQVSLDHTLVAEHHLRLAFSQHLSEVKHDRPPANPDDHPHDVLDQQHRHARRVHGPNHVERLVDLHVVEARHNLIQQQKLGPGRHRARHLEPLAIRDRERRHRMTCLRPKADQLEHLISQSEGPPNPAAT